MPSNRRMGKQNSTLITVELTSLPSFSQQGRKQIEQGENQQVFLVPFEGSGHGENC